MSRPSSEYMLNSVVRPPASFSKDSALFHELPLSYIEWKVLSFIDGRRTAQQIAVASGLSVHIADDRMAMRNHESDLRGVQQVYDIVSSVQDKHARYGRMAATVTPEFIGKVCERLREVVGGMAEALVEEARAQSGERVGEFLGALNEVLEREEIADGQPAGAFRGRFALVVQSVIASSNRGETP